LKQKNIYKIILKKNVKNPMPDDMGQKQPTYEALPKLLIINSFGSTLMPNNLNSAIASSSVLLSTIIR